MAFFRKKSDTIQQKINSLKGKRSSADPPRDDSSASPNIQAVSPEERSYLESLENSLQNGKSILAVPGKRKRTGAPVIPAVRLEEPQDDGDFDPFSVAEREVESLVRLGQKNFEQKRAKQTLERIEDKKAAHEAVMTPPPETETEEPAPPPLPTAPPAAESAPAPQPPSPQTERQVQVDSSYDEKGNLPFAPGTIVRLNDDSLGIIKEEIPDREYDLVYMLTLEGKVEPRGVCLFAMGIERLGRLPQEELSKIEKRMAWSRDHLIYYLDHVKLADGIPQPSPGNKPLSNDHQRFDDGKSMQRGRCLSVRFGDKKWEAVFWGEDSTGSIVAHCQQNQWELLHMDLKRFGSSLQTGKLIQGRELREIEESVIDRYKPSPS